MSQEAKFIVVNQTQINPSTVSQIQKQELQIEQPILQRSIPKSSQNKIYKRYKWGMGASVCCFVVFLVIAIAGPFILQATINSLIGKQTILGKDNIKVWGSLPGDSGADFVRDFAFFNFSNWQDFILHGDKPQFSEVQGYKVSQLQDYIDIDWKQNDEVVGINSWIRFAQKSDSRNLDENVYILNPGPLGFWDTIKNSHPSLVLNQGIGISFLNTESLIKNIIMGMTLSAQFLPDFETAWLTIFQPSDITRQNALFIWYDVSHGMSSSSTLDEWITASEEGPMSKDAQDLGNYFTLDSSQLSNLILFFTQFREAANNLVMSNYFCFDQATCTGFDLAVKQYASMGVTYKPPPSKAIQPSPSICSLNYSCKNYYAQLASYYQFEFLINNTQKQYKNLTFSEASVSSWFYHDGSNLNMNQSCLLHLGNLKALWDNGTQYDSNPSNEQPLLNIQNRFMLQTKAHTFVFWNWIKYIYQQFIQRSRQGGNVQHTAACLYGTQYFYISWAKTLDRLHTLLLKYKIRNMLSGTSCSDLFNSSMRTTNEVINKLCSNYDTKSLDSIQKLIMVCRYRYNDEWDMMNKIVNNTLAMQEFCDRSDDDGFAGAYEKAEIYLDSYYHCDQTPLPYCSDYQLAAKQWASSNITKNPIPQLKDDYQSATTIHKWFEDIKPFEYGHWVTKYPNETLPTINASQAYVFMSHDNLWSLNTWQEVLIETNPQELIDRYGIQHQDVMARYLRYAVIYVTFDGFVKARKVRDLLFGYSDELVQYIRKRSPLIGGDPTRPELIHLNDLNLTKQEASKYPMELHTGKNHPERTAYIKSINGKGIINFNTSEWTGNDTRNFTDTPWEEEVTIIGSDGKQSAPKQHAEPFNISIFVPSAMRTVTAKYAGESTQKFGLKVNKFGLDKSFFQSSDQNPDNAKYYQKIPGFVNLTKIYSFPIFASKNHFYGIDSNWNDLVDIWDENHTFKYQPSKYDDSLFYIEPYSGVTFQATVYLMLNYYYTPDILFQTEGARMLPIFNVYQSGNFSEGGANKLLGSLKTGLSMKKVLLGLGLALAILFLISFIVLLVLYKKRKIYDKKKQSLIEVEEESEEVTV